ncbi:MAG: pilus assembly protein PilM [Phycisphaerae bacterium]|nr:pilus assembly protein PilM [Phycisphaerae bacterium]
MSRKPEIPSEAWGLEFGGSAVRLVHVTRTGSSYRADRYFEVALGERWDSVPSLAAALDKLGAGVKPTGLLAVAVPDEWVLHRVMALPSAAPAALGAMVANQIELLLPTQAASFTWSWTHAADPFQAGKTRVLVCAARKDALAVLSHCLSALGQAPAAALPSSIALATAWPLLHASNGSLLLVDVAARSTSLVVLHQGRCIRCAVIDEGGDHWTLRLAASEHLAPAQAESVKLDSSSDGALPPALSSHVAQRLAQETARWARQLLEAYSDCVADIPRPQRPTRCVLVGRASLTQGLVGLVNATLGMTTSLAGLPANLSVDSRVAFDQAAGAISAAVAVMQEAPPAVNLARAAPTRRPVWHQASWRWAVVAAWLLAATAVLYGLDLHHASRLRQAVADVQAKIGGQGAWNLAKAVGQHLESGAPPPLDVLEEISALAPAQVQITAWRYSRKGAISLTGTVPSEEEHQNFLKRLSEAASVTRVEPGPVKREQNRLTFEVTFTGSAVRRSAASQPTSQPASQPTTSVGSDQRRGWRDRSSGDFSDRDRSDRASRRSRRRSADTERAAVSSEMPSDQQPPDQARPLPPPPEQDTQNPPEGQAPPGNEPGEEPTSQPAEQQES